MAAPALRVRPSREQWVSAVVIAGLVAAVGLRVWILSSGLGGIDMDEAVVGLMARHVLDGDMSVFFWGQTYGGSQEAILTAVPFAVFGESAVALKLVPILAFVGAAWLVWRIGRRTIGEPAARIAAVLFLLGPGVFVWRSTRAYGFYGTGILVCTASLLLVLRLRERTSRLELAGLGLLAGIGWWATAQVVCVLAPALVWLVVTAPRVLRQIHVFALAALAGSAPWLLWSVTHDWASLRADIDIPGNTYFSHLEHFFSPLLPAALGLRHVGTLSWVPNALIGWGLYLAALAGFAYLLWKRPPRLGLLLVVAATYPLLFALSPYAWYTLEPRYLFLLSPVIALLLARPLVTPARQVIGVGLVLALSIATLAPHRRGDPSIPKAQLTPVIEALEARNVHRVFTPYALAYRLNLDGDERVIATPLSFVRQRSWDALVRTSPAPGYVFVRGSELSHRFELALLGRGIAAEHLQVDNFDIYLPATKLAPEDWVGAAPIPVA